jgi:hypothetical protein
MCRNSTRRALRAHGSPGAASGFVHAVVGRFVPVNQFETPGDPTLPTELSGELRAAVERWAAQQPDKPTLAEAVRRLVEDGLATD